MDTDLNLQPGEFNTALSIFYVGYVIGEIPSNMAVGLLFVHKYTVQGSSPPCDRLFFLSLTIVRGGGFFFCMIAWLLLVVEAIWPQALDPYCDVPMGNSHDCHGCC